VIRKVISLKDQKEYVMKKITLSHASAHKQQAILKEAAILKQLDHPHIIKYFTSFIENSYFFIIMEYAEGGDLSRVTFLINFATMMIPLLSKLLQILFVLIETFSSNICNCLL